MPRKSIPKEIEATVLIMCRRRCAICFGLNRDAALKQGQIAHLDQSSANPDLDNLVFLCFEHHDQYDSRTSQSKGLTPNEVRQFRIELHEAIDRAWREPVRIGEMTTAPADPIAGHYIREGEFASAELEVTRTADGRVRVSGLALWGKTREYGPNLGELDFEAEVKAGQVFFRDESVERETYSIELTFLADAVVAREHYVIGYFGMNARFESIYKRVRPA